jgi:DNA-binding MarR family transcriptional regulator
LICLSAAVSKNSAKPDRLVSQRILVLSNVLRRAAGLRYRRLLGLQAGEWGVIAELGHQSPCTLNDLAGRIGVDKTQLSRTVARLIARGLVQRRRNPRDNRAVRLSLTPKGQDRHAGIMRAGRKANLSLLAALSARERKQLVDLIERVTVRARDLLRAESP